MPDDPHQAAYLAIVRAQDHLQGPFNALFRDHGLSQPQYNALRIIQGAGRGGIPSQEISSHMISRSPDMTKLVDRLEGQGWVERGPDPEDRRRIRVTITAGGRKKLRSLESKVMALHERQLGHVSRKDLRALTALLEQVLPS